MNWERIASLSLDTPMGEVGYDCLRRPDGATTGSSWADVRDAVAVVALREGDEDEREVVLIEEYRPRLRETVVSCPVGRLDDGESFEAGAARELREETGFDPGRVELLDVHYPTSWLRTRRAIAFATDLRRVGPDRDDSEFIEPLTVPAEGVVERVRTDGPATGWTLTPLLLAREEGLL